MKYQNLFIIFGVTFVIFLVISYLFDLDSLPTVAAAGGFSALCAVGVQKMLRR